MLKQRLLHLIWTCIFMFAFKQKLRISIGSQFLPTSYFKEFTFHANYLTNSFFSIQINNAIDENTNGPLILGKFGEFLKWVWHDFQLLLIMLWWILLNVLTEKRWCLKNSFLVDITNKSGNFMNNSKKHSVRIMHEISAWQNLR